MPVSPQPEDFPLDRALAFGQRLAEARKAVGYASQTAFARAAKVHPLTVHKHEKQGRMPSRLVVREYARLTGRTEAWLLYGVDDPLMDLPEVVRDYLLGPHGATMTQPVFDRLSRITWDLLTDDYLDREMVHEVRLLVERNLALRAQSPDAQRVPPVPERRAVQLHLPRVQAPRSQALTA